VTDKTGSDRAGGGSVFKTFPEFSKLRLADKQYYESLIRTLPPVADISFTELMTWWDPLDAGVPVAMLNGNLVISYWLPGDEKNSGLSLIGVNKVDESICTVFDYLKEMGEPVRLVNVPEFVVSRIRYTELFNSTEQRQFHEYLVDTSCFYPLKNVASFKRKRIEKVLKRVGEEKIVLKSLDLSSVKERELLLNTAENWWHRNINDFGQVEREALMKCILNPEQYEVENLCLFVDQELYGFCLYHRPPDTRYVVIPHIKATHEDTLGFDLMGYCFARWFAERGVMYGNLTADKGRLRLRMFLLTLGPTGFFRKYKVEPVV
jgi:hypothetical protein